MTEFVTAASVEEAINLVANGHRPIAGGTDLVVAARQAGHPLPEKLVSIGRLIELSGIDPTAEGLLVGAVVSHSRLLRCGEIVERCTALADASALVGSPATRHVGTLGGNIMNASPAADTAAPLVVLGAEIVLRSARGQRRVNAGDFWIAPGRTCAEDDELCTAVFLPAAPGRSGSAYVRLEYRRAMEIAVVGAAARVELGPDGRIVDAAVALTAVAPTIISVDGVADLLRGREPDDSALAEIAAAASLRSEPISDLRASAEYRRHGAGVMARRAVEAAARRAAGDVIAVPVNRSIGIGAAQ